MCSENMQQIYRKTLMPKCDFNKAAKQLYWKRTSEWEFSFKQGGHHVNVFFLGVGEGLCKILDLLF